MKLETTMPDAYAPQRAIDGDGRALVVWSEREPSLDKDWNNTWAVRFERGGRAGFNVSAAPVATRDLRAPLSRPF
jgi:hypothetical protein